MISFADIDESLRSNLETISGFPASLDWPGNTATQPYFMIFSLTANERGGSMASGNEMFDAMYQIDAIGKSRQSVRALQDISHAFMARHYHTIVGCWGEPRLDAGPARREQDNAWKAHSTFRIPVYALVDVDNPSPPVDDEGFLFVQSSPALVWTINHNLGYNPVIAVFNAGNVQVFAQVVHTSLNQTVVTLASAMAGYARLI